MPSSRALLARRAFDRNIGAKRPAKKGRACLRKNKTPPEINAVVANCADAA